MRAFDELMIKPISNKGEFSVSETGNKVIFSSGNLYWNGSKFMFENNQGDFPTTWSTSHVGHFFWSSKANVARSRVYDETGSVNDILFTNKDGFVVNDEINTGKTLTRLEGLYVLNQRKVKGDTGFGYTCQVVYVTENDIQGFIIYPDDYSGTLFNTGQHIDIIPEGCAFLPNIGVRNSSTISPLTAIRYGESECLDAYQGYEVFVDTTDCYPGNVNERYKAQAIRLVKHI